MKNIFTKIISTLVIGIMTVFPFVSSAQSVLRAPQGGTGIGTVGPSDVGKFLRVLDDSPFTFDLATGGGGGGTPAAPLHGVQYNNPLGTFDADAQFVRNSITEEFAVEGNLTADPFESFGVYVDGNFLGGGLVDGAYLLHNDPTNTQSAAILVGNGTGIDPSLANVGLIRVVDDGAGDETVAIFTPTSSSIVTVDATNVWNFHNSVIGGGWSYNSNNFIDLDPTTAINHIDMGSVGDPDIAIRSYVALTAVQAQLDLIGYQSTATTLNLYLGTAIPTPGTVTGSLNFIGSAVTSLTTGSNNTTWGYTSCQTITSGSGNTCLGRNSGGTVTAGTNNTILGFGSKVGNNSTGSVVIGRNAGSSSLQNGLVPGTSTQTVVIGENSGLALGNSGGRNTFVGYDSGSAVSTGVGNTLIGNSAGKAIVGGSDNTIIGDSAGRDGTASFSNSVFVGRSAGEDNEADRMTCVGLSACSLHKTGIGNSALGYHAFGANITGASNTAVGDAAMGNNTGGDNNIAIGAGALRDGLSVYSNVTAIGKGAGEDNISSDNIFVGFGTGAGHTTGGSNTVVGTSAYAGASTGDSNSIFGYGSSSVLGTGLDNVIIGVTSAVALVNANSNVIIGSDALQNSTTGSANVLIGDDVATDTTTAGDLNVIIGRGATLANGVSASIGIGGTVDVTSSNQMVVGSTVSPITDIYVGEGVSTATPSAVTFQSSQASGTDTVGGNLSWFAGASTGNANGGQFALGTSPMGVASGTGVNSPISLINMYGNGVGRGEVILGDVSNNRFGVDEKNNNIYAYYAGTFTQSDIAGDRFSIFDATGLTGVIGDIDATANGGTISFTDTATTLDDMHLAFTQTTDPTTDLTGTSLNDGGGTGAACTITVGGTDNSGEINITAGNGTPTAGLACRVVFDFAMNNTTSVTLTPSGFHTPLEPYISNLGSTGFDIYLAVALGASEGISYYYQVN